MEPFMEPKMRADKLLPYGTYITSKCAWDYNISVEWEFDALLSIITGFFIKNCVG